MYKIPESFDTSVLEGVVIIQIGFGLNFITLFFNEGFIHITGGFSFNYGGRLNTYDEACPVRDDFGLLQILEIKVKSISINDNRDELVIKFENGAILCLIGNEMYESFVINFNGSEVMV